jgi:hypothetical protein
MVLFTLFLSREEDLTGKMLRVRNKTTKKITDLFEINLYPFSLSLSGTSIHIVSGPLFGVF